jgi:hypothetical protein
MSRHLSHRGRAGPLHSTLLRTSWYEAGEGLIIIDALQIPIGDVGDVSVRADEDVGLLRNSIGATELLRRRCDRHRLQRHTGCRPGDGRRTATRPT